MLGLLLDSLVPSHIFSYSLQNFVRHCFLCNEEYFSCSVELHIGLAGQIIVESDVNGGKAGWARRAGSGCILEPGLKNWPGTGQPAFSGAGWVVLPSLDVIGCISYIPAYSLTSNYCNLVSWQPLEE